MQQIENRMVLQELLELEEEKAICYTCAECGEPIYEDDECTIFEFTGEYIHDECLEGFLDGVCIHIIAEREEL